MKKEIFEKISLESLVRFFDIIIESESMKIEWISSLFSDYHNNFDDTANFLTQLNQMNLVDKKIVLKDSFSEFITRYSNSLDKLEFAKNYLMDLILFKNKDSAKIVYNFLNSLSLFELSTNLSKHKSQNLKYSGLRNFLLEADFLDIDYNSYQFRIKSKYIPSINRISNLTKLSPSTLENIKKRQKEIGKAAEEKVLEYEKNRLKAFKGLVNKIEYTATINVAAGYDIRSFEGYETINDRPLDERYIEVKAVSPFDYLFYLSKNEYDVSKRYLDSYFLYLLPVKNDNQFKMDSMEIINNPYKNIFKQSQQWQIVNETFSIRKKLDHE